MSPQLIMATTYDLSIPVSQNSRSDWQPHPNLHLHPQIPKFLGKGRLRVAHIHQAACKFCTASLLSNAGRLSKCANAALTNISENKKGSNSALQRGSRKQSWSNWGNLDTKNNQSLARTLSHSLILCAHMLHAHMSICTCVHVWLLILAIAIAWLFL